LRCYTPINYIHSKQFSVPLPRHKAILEKKGSFTKFTRFSDTLAVPLQTDSK